MKKHLKYIISIAILGIGVLAVTRYNFIEMCQECGKRPTKSYVNNDSGEKEYYCMDCAADCEFCSQKATKYYTSGFGTIVFVCNDCYQDILDFNN